MTLVHHCLIISINLKCDSPTPSPIDPHSQKKKKEKSKKKKKKSPIHPIKLQVADHKININNNKLERY